MPQLKIIAKRDEPLNLGDINLAVIQDPTTAFDIEIVEELEGEQPKTVYTYEWIPKQEPTPGPEPEPPIPPDHLLLWDSNRDGHWDDGKKRVVIKSEGDIKPDGKGIEMRASGKPKLEVNGDGTSNLVCQPGHGRFYTFATNFNSRLELDFALTNNTDNLSLKLRSRHQEGQSPENRFGGYGCSISLDEIGVKREDYHNVHSNSKSKALSQKLKTDTWYSMAFTVKNSKDNKIVNYNAEVDFKDGKGLVPVLAHTDPSPKPYMLDEALYKKNSYFWIRQNNEETATIRLRNVKLTQVQP